MMSDNLRLPVLDNLSLSAGKRVLSLTGGGYRGLYTAAVLAAIEQEIQPRTLFDCFDVFAGTSVGGMIATALAVGVPASAILETLNNHGPSIFPHKYFAKIRQATGVLYRQAPLSSAISACLDKWAQSSMNDVEKGLILASINGVAGATQLFVSSAFGHESGVLPTLLDICLATSAAPSYFPSHVINGTPMIDGGLVANNPDVIALFTVLKRWPAEAETMHMLSVGTAGVGSAGMAGDMPRSGVGWVKRMLPLILAAQEQLAANQAASFLAGRYLRINHVPAARQGALSALNIVNKSMTDTLMSIARQSVKREFLRSKILMDKFFC